MSVGTRELAAAVAIPIVLAALFLAPPIVFNLLVAVVALGALWEFYRMAEQTGHPVAKTLGIVFGGLVLGDAAILWGPIRIVTASGVLVQVAARQRPGGWFALVLLGAGLAAAAPLFARVPAAMALAGASSTAFGVLLIALPATSVCYLRDHSPRSVLFLLGLVWICDSAAYYVGRRYGSRLLAPIVSPKKTWEGTIGGFVAATLFGALAGTWWFVPELGPVRGAFAGALASTAGQLGDLIESLWKRGAGVKDSGTFLPGHGGFYDRIDSMLFAAPVVAGFLAWLQR